MGHKNRVMKANNIAEIRDLARKRLPRGIFEFIDRGAEDETAMTNNSRALDHIRLQPRVLVDVSERTTDASLFGKSHSMPVAIAPTGAAGLVWYEGELELARAAAAMNVPFTLATRSMTSIEDIAEKAGGTLWFQLYMWADRSLSYSLVDRAEKAGFQALIVTVDAPVTPNREYNQRNGFSLPFRLTRQSALDISAHPGWLVGVMGKYLTTTGMPRYENQPGEHRMKITKGAPALQSMRADTLSWEDIRELRRRWPRTLMIKGILRADDAQKAAACGVDAVIASNHGGRCLDSAIAPIDALPAIVKAVDRKMAVFCDSGIRRGSHIAKALALGASGVLLGRSTLFGTAIAGRTGAMRALDILQKELLTVMAMTGATSLEDLNHTLIATVAPAHE